MLRHLSNKYQQKPNCSDDAEFVFTLEQCTKSAAEQGTEAAWFSEERPQSASLRVILA